MAVDEALFLSAISGNAPPTVRLYRWSRPSISIGYRQDLSEACDLAACRRLGVDTVRRISGGRAVLHHHELTYCVTAGADGNFRGLSVLEIYRWITDALRAAFESMRVVVDPPSATRSSNAPAVENPALPCFAVPTGHEITAGGKKLVGSAQKWTARGFLQHGSIILELDRELLKTTTALARDSALGAVGLNDLANKSVETAELAGFIGESFETLFGQPPSSGVLSETERRIVRTLALEKYGSDSWNLHRKPGTLKPHFF
jgi:lipoate-protein ligase A